MYSGHMYPGTSPYDKLHAHYTRLHAYNSAQMHFERDSCLKILTDSLATVSVVATLPRLR